MHAPVARPRVAVIGGGFSGAAFAVHLLRDFSGVAFAVEIIEPRATLGAGLAYGSTDQQHRINVAAARMAMFAEDPDHFDRWARARDVQVTDPDSVAPGVGLFPRRAMFGAYVHATLRHAAVAAPFSELTHTRARARAVSREGGLYRIALDNGAVTLADVVVLAVGHPAAEPPAALAGLAGDRGLIADPWAKLDVAPDARVLIVGTGLTMTDVVASLRAGGHRGDIVALSRRGLLPRGRTRLPVRARGQFADPPSHTAAALLRRVRAEIAAGNAAGRPWEDVIDALRVQGRGIWTALPPAERRRLLRHAQPYWDVHRYQCAPRIEALLRRETADGGLRVLAASLRGALRRPGGDLVVTVHPRGTPVEHRLDLACDVVITCTGPAHRRAVLANPLLADLSGQGLIAADPYGLGIDVDPRGRAIDANGVAAARLFVVGPPARGTWGELMGLPQVSTQPREVAGHVAALLGQHAFFPAQEAEA